MGGREDFVNALKAIAAEKREELGGPPTPEELLAWRDGRLDPAARERVERQLAVYPDAARALADLAAFPEVEPAPGAPVLPEEGAEERWQALRARLMEIRGPAEGAEPVAEAPAPAPPREAPAPPVPPGRPVRRRRPAWRLAAAAGLLLAVAWGAYLAGRAGRSPAAGPAINVALAELAPVGEERMRSEGALPLVEVPEEAEELVLLLGLVDEGDFPDYEAEILGADGARRWSRSGLRPSPLGTFHVAFRRHELPPGVYRIQLFSREGERKELLATYGFRLLEPDED